MKIIFETIDGKTKEYDVLDFEELEADTTDEVADNVLDVLEGCRFIRVDSDVYVVQNITKIRVIQ